MIRLITIGLTLAVMAPAQAASLKRRSLSDATDNGGSYRYRGAGGGCVLGDGSRVYRPNPYWTPCDYSQGPQVPEGCGD